MSSWSFVVGYLVVFLFFGVGGEGGVVLGSSRYFSVGAVFRSVFYFKRVICFFVDNVDRYFYERDCN